MTKLLILILQTVVSLNLFAANITHRTLPVGGPRNRAATPTLTADDLVVRGLVTPAEFEPASELQMTEDTFMRIAASLAKTVDQTATIVVLVDNDAAKEQLKALYQSLGGDVSRLKVWVAKYDSIWYQDYGPIYSFDGTGALITNDFIYDRFNRHNDDVIPEKLAALDQIPNHKVKMNYEGGNFVADGEGNCFASTRVFQQNPSLSQSQVRDLMKANLGCSQLITLTPLEEDDTYHIDLFAKLVDKNTFLVADILNDETNKKIMDGNAEVLKQMGYRVVRIPVQHKGGFNFLTHVNSFLINGYVLLPVYDIPEDEVAKKIYEDLGYKVLQVDTSDMQGTGGAVHCILRSKPKH